MRHMDERKSKREKNLAHNSNKWAGPNINYGMCSAVRIGKCAVSMNFGKILHTKEPVIITLFRDDSKQH